ncbi:MAG: type VI secretion system lipoprotein TssJ [Desulfohalobiaceae bacterium]
MASAGPRSICILFFALLTLTACGGGKDKPDPSQVPATKPAPAEDPAKVHWTYEPEVLELKVYSKKDLNSYNDHAHATRLCIYQLRKPSDFKQLAASKSGVKKLLQCKSFASSVVDFEKHYIQPGQDVSLTLDRAENAKHVGLVAGYYDLNPKNVSRLYDIPLHKEKEGHLWWSKELYTPGKLTMKVLFDTHGMQRVGEK